VYSEIEMMWLVYISPAGMSALGRKWTDKMTANGQKWTYDLDKTI